jgi:hypothetical protein
MKHTPEVPKCAMKSSLILYETSSLHGKFDYFIGVIVFYMFTFMYITHTFEKIIYG